MTTGSAARGYVQEYVEKIASEHSAKSQTEAEPTVAEGSGFNIHAYICGSNEMVAANRETLKKLGWQRKQIVFLSGTTEIRGTGYKAR